NTGAMSADPFGSCFDDHICSIFYRLEKIPASTKGVVNDQWQIVFPRQRCNFLKVWYVVAWIPNGFDKDSFCFIVDKRLHVFRSAFRCKTSFDSQSLEGYLKLVIGSAI